MIFKYRYSTVNLTKNIKKILINETQLIKKNTRREINQSVEQENAFDEKGTEKGFRGTES
jgi:hypothetical protein